MDRRSLLPMGWIRNSACVGGGLLLLLVSRRFTRRQSSTSPLSFLKQSFGGQMIWPFSCLMKSAQAEEVDHESDEDPLEWTISHEGLEFKERSMVPGDLEPNIISVTDLQDPSMVLGDLEPNIISVTDPQDPSTMPGDLEPNIISVADPRDPSSGSCFFMKSGLPKNAFPGSRADCNLIEWLRDREANGVMPLATLDVLGLRTPTYVRDEIRLLIKSMIQFIQYLHGQGRCMSGGGSGTLRLENVHLVGQNLKFDALELSSFTEELQDEDYKSVCCMITSTIFKKNTDLLPYDMQHLLKLMMNPRPHVYLISKHVALMNSIACRDFILLLWDKRKTMSPAVHLKWKNSIKGLKVGNDRWADNIHSESPLLKVYQGAKYRKTNKLQLIRFFRNAAAHLSDYSCRGERFQFEHISLIITDSFPTVLPDLQERLDHHGILQEFCKLLA